MLCRICLACSSFLSTESSVYQAVSHVMIRAALQDLAVLNCAVLFLLASTIYDHRLGMMLPIEFVNEPAGLESFRYTAVFKVPTCLQLHCCYDLLPPRRALVRADRFSRYQHIRRHVRSRPREATHDTIRSNCYPPAASFRNAATKPDRAPYNPTRTSCVQALAAEQAARVTNSTTNVVAHC
jgi:hypothetical protein